MTVDVKIDFEYQGRRRQLTLEPPGWAARRDSARDAMGSWSVDAGLARVFVCEHTFGDAADSRGRNALIRAAMRVIDEVEVRHFRRRATPLKQSTASPGLR
jgi:hypothetical protein